MTDVVRTRVWSVAAPILVALACAVIAWLRMAPAARGVLWAEDGEVFLARAAHPDQMSAWIFTPYDGYVHALPQLVALIVWALFPTKLFAVAVTAVCCLISGAVAGAVFALTRDWNLSLIGRLVLAASTVLAAGLSAEVLGNLASLHLFLLWLMPFILLARPRTRAGAIVLAAAAFAIGVSEIQSFVFAPLLLWRWRRPDRWPVIAGVAAASAIQLVAVLGGSRTRGTPASVASVVDGYFLQVPLTGLVGSGRRAAVIVAHAGWPIAYAAVMPFVLCAAWYAWRSWRRTALVLLFIGGSIVLWCAGFAVNFNDSFDFADLHGAQLIAASAQLRYAIIPTLLLLGVLALAIGARPRASHQSHRVRLGQAAVLVATLAVFAVGLMTPANSLRASGPNWRAEIEQAQRTCADDADLTVVIATAPTPWEVQLDCALINS